jgi:hypothetical protein
MVAVAHRHLMDSIDTGHELAQEAARSLGHAAPAWGLMVVGGQHDGATTLAAARDRLGDVPIVGGACVGTIVSGGASYSGYESSLMLFSEAPEAIVRVDEVAGTEYAAGRRLGVALAPHLSGSSTVLLFFDTPRPDGLGLVIGSELLDGIYSAIGETGDTILGAGLIGDPACASGFVFTGDASERDAAVAVVLRDALTPEIQIMHGAVPLGHVHRVTAAKGTRIMELDGRPAVAVLMEGLGVTESDLAENPIAFSVLLGRRADQDHMSPTSTDDMVIRLIIAVDLDAGWVQLFESDIGVGDRLEVMLRDPHSIFESVECGVVQFANSVAAGAKFGLYIDCAGRTAPFSGTETDEAMIVASAVPEDWPFMGFYVGREIAPVLGRGRPHDWTGVLITMSEAA